MSPSGRANIYPAFCAIMVRFGAVCARCAKFEIYRVGTIARDLGLWIRIDRCDIGAKRRLCWE